MPLSQAQPDALARTYASSLLELAEAEGGQQRIEEALGELEDILEIARADERFSEFLSSRVLPSDTREQSLRRIFHGRVSSLVERFLLVLNEKARLGHLPAIVASADQMVQERFGRVEVDVYTASPVSGEELTQIRERLASALGKEVIVHPYTDRSMIGGVRFGIGDQLIDGSVASRLRRMRERLMTTGNARVRANAQNIIENGDAPAA